MNSQLRRLKVLVVDDEQRIAQTTADILRNAAFDVAVAYDGWEALELAAHFGPDHLLSDVVMPGMNGTELAIAVRKMYPALKVLLFTAQVGISEILGKAEKQGFTFEVIAKPIHPRKLIQRIRNQHRA